MTRSILFYSLFSLFAAACGSSSTAGSGATSGSAASSSSAMSTVSTGGGSSSSSSSSSGGAAAVTCGASQSVIAEGDMTAPGELDDLTSCTVMSVAASPLTVVVGCDDGMGGTDMITMTLMATPAIATSLKQGDAAQIYYGFSNIEGPATWAAILDMSGDIVLGFVDAYNLSGIGMPSFGEPFELDDVACSDDAIRQAVSIKGGGGSPATIADGHRGTFGPNMSYVAQVEKAIVDPSMPSQPSHYVLAIAKQP